MTFHINFEQHTETLLKTSIGVKQDNVLFVGVGVCGYVLSKRLWKPLFIYVLIWADAAILF